MLEKFLQEQNERLSLDFVAIKIDLSEMENGTEVAKRLRKSRTGGIPWMVILDANGKELVSSDGPQGNCGYPFRPHEVDHFLHMLRSTSTRMDEKQLVEPTFPIWVSPRTDPGSECFQQFASPPCLARGDSSTFSSLRRRFLGSYTWNMLL